MSEALEQLQEPPKRSQGKNPGSSAVAKIPSVGEQLMPALQKRAENVTAAISAYKAQEQAYIDRELGGPIELGESGALDFSNLFGGTP